MASRFRSWWQPPRKTSEQPETRSVSFLELFYDLVYVVSVAELAHALTEHPDWKGVGTFAFLFAIIWWSWLNGSSYHDLHGNNDIRTRVFTFSQMFAVAGMAVFAHSALSEGSVGFAVSYAAFQLIMTYLWWRTGVYDQNHRALSGFYSLGFLIATLLFVFSVFVPTPLRFYLWGIALLISLSLPLTQFFVKDKRGQAEIERVLSLSSSLVERFGLFTMIVLAEVIVGVVRGLAGHSLSPVAGWTAALGLMIALGFWWLYFDFISHRKPNRSRVQVAVWIYLHLFITLSITATGAAVLNVVEHAGEALPPNVRWLLVGAVAVFLLSIAAIMQVIKVTKELQNFYRTGGLICLVGSIAVALLGLTSLATQPLLIFIVVLMLFPVIYGVIVWVMVFEAQSIQLH